MNSIKLMGGIGNQLFQYSFGKAQNQNGITVVYDINFYAHAKATDTYPRLYHLDKFKTNITVGSFIVSRKTYRENTKYGFNLDLLKIDNANFDGYWQYYPYIKSVLPILRQEIVLQEKYYNKEFLNLRDDITGCTSVSVHVRRGDYLTHKGIFRNLKLDYYMRALAVCPEGDQIFVFSDDIPWCRDKFKKEYFYRDIVFVDQNEYLSFELMRLCKHHVIANSTFSYWAAILKEDSEQIVVCPKEWLVNRIQDNDNEIFFPKHWIKIQGNVI
jgi:hypothetical protein